MGACAPTRSVCASLASPTLTRVSQPFRKRPSERNIFHGVDNDSPQFLRQQFNTWVALDRLESRFCERPAEIASLYVTLASMQSSSYTTGQVWCSDGGNGTL